MAGRGGRAFAAVGPRDPNRPSRFVVVEVAAIGHDRRHGRDTHADDDAGGAAASLENVAPTSLAGPLSVVHLDELERVFRDHQLQWGPASLSLTIVKGHVTLPDPPARARRKAMHAKGATADVASVVIEADGFWAAAARGVLASMSLVSREARQVTRPLDEALRRGSKHLPAEAPDVVALAPLIVGFRERHLAQLAVPPPKPRLSSTSV